MVLLCANISEILWRVALKVIKNTGEAACFFYMSELRDNMNRADAPEDYHGRRRSAAGAISAALLRCCEQSDDGARGERGNAEQILLLRS